jgi:hypothetical protein
MQARDLLLQFCKPGIYFCNSASPGFTLAIPKATDLPFAISYEKRFAESLMKYLHQAFFVNLTVRNKVAVT